MRNLQAEPSLAHTTLDNDDREGAWAQRKSPVAPAKDSEDAKAKADTKLTSDRLPVHSFTTLLADLTTLTPNDATVPSNPHNRFPVFAQPTPSQSRAFKLLEIDAANSSRDQAGRSCYMSSPKIVYPP